MNLYFTIFVLIMVIFINLAIDLLQNVEGMAGITSDIDINDIKSVPTSGKIPYGWFIIPEPDASAIIKTMKANGVNIDTSKGIMTKIPYGFTTEPGSGSGVSLIPITESARYKQSLEGSSSTIPKVTGLGSGNLTRYDPNNYNVEFHDSIDTLVKQNDSLVDQSNSIYVKDASGNLVTLPWSSVKGNTTYYQPGSYIYGAQNYVPNYEDSVFLSKLTQMSYTTPIYDSATQLGGICTYYRHDPQKLEQACNNVDTNSCASTSCCVLLGGSKCVSGNEKGPIMKANYTDLFIKNRDHYYYQGQCYGNCNYEVR